jgi:hypothetical protein
MTLAELDRRLQYGPGMRVQRLVEASFLLAVFLTGDVRPAFVTLALTALQALSGRLVPVAALVAVVHPGPEEHSVSDIYFDLQGTRGACAISLVVQAAGMGLYASGHTIAGGIVLAIPLSSFVLSPTVGFCCGCAVYVGLRELLARFGLAARFSDGICDVDVRAEAPRRQ